MPLALLLLLSCSPEPPPDAPAPTPAPALPAARFTFKALPTASPNADGTVLLAGLADGQGYAWHPLLEEGVAYGDGPAFGTVPDAQGRPLPMHGKATCSDPDASMLFEAHERTWLLTHLECAPSALVLSELEPAEGGAFTVSRSRPVDLSAVGGLNQLCAADRTPWGTMLGGQEFETDAALWVDGRIDPTRTGTPKYWENSRYEDFARYGAQPPSPYANGWMHESRLVDAEGGVQVELRLAMGRFSHELARVMPDQRTVYLSDDTSYGILAMFVADRPGDLSAGRLYAARFEQQSEQGDARVRWIDLGHADDATIRAALDAGVRFEQLYDRSLAIDGACPDGHRLVRGPQSVDECLRAAPGSEVLASRLETRRAAGLAGATVELQKEEGLAVDPDGKRLFVAISRVTHGMLAQDPPEADHLALAPNRCGMVWGLQLEGGAADAAGQPIESEWVATVARTEVAGRMLEDGTCDPGSISEPDNLAWAAGARALLIAEDTDRAPNLLWAWQDGQLIPLFGAFPATEGGLAEVSGLSWVPDVGGAAWITLSLQHPGSRPATMGLLGPFPPDP